MELGPENHTGELKLILWEYIGSIYRGSIRMISKGTIRVSEGLRSWVFRVPLKRVLQGLIGFL